MHRLIQWGVIALLFGASAACAERSDTQTVSKEHGAAAQGNDAETADGDATPARTHEAPNPDGKFNSSCDFLMPEDITSGDYTFVAAAKLHNTGNIGIVVRVKATWDQVASHDITMSKTVHLRRGAHRTVKFKVPVGQSQVSEFQDSPGYLDGDGACRVKATITDSYGSTPLEG